MAHLEEILKFIQSGDTTQLESAVKKNPKIAEEKTTQGISLLQYAAYCRNKEAIDLLRKHLPQINLYEAAATGDFDIVKQEIEEHPDSLNSYSPDGFTALGLACFFGHFPIVNYLIEQGADVNKPSNNSFKVAPIHSACAISNYDIAELLLLHGADANAKQQAAVTPMHEAAHNGQTKLAQLLIDNGADVNAKTETGQTPLFMAEEKPFEETAALIKKYGGR